ncbi:MAG TPA: hypothetical protein VHZ31_03900 [Solirubrobacteraceae bacterium]|jgi:hypothetical protein|nr:hypothetical protein [Solirubrobacteraceae bacterium]
MSLSRPTVAGRRRRRRAPRPLTAALAELLRIHRPAPAPPGDALWISVTPALAAATARIAARRDGSITSYHDHGAHEAARRPVLVPAAIAAQWCRDAWQAAGEGLIGVPDALLLAAQIDPRGAA